jgi:hypothetical protein
MIRMTAVGNGLCALGLVALLGGCASGFKKTEERVKTMDVNCETAEGDLRELQNEKASVAQQITMGVTSVAPIGLVIGLVRGNAGTKYRVAVGDYNKALDAKIAEIKSTCSIP